MSRWWCQIMLVWAETLWGRKKGAAEEKDSNDPVTFDTVLQMQNGYSSRNLTKRACFDVNWYRQWPVAGSVGCLSVSREAYQMTLKISSTTIKFEGEWASVSQSVGTRAWRRQRAPRRPNYFFVSSPSRSGGHKYSKSNPRGVPVLLLDLNAFSLLHNFAGWHLMGSSGRGRAGDTWTWSSSRCSQQHRNIIHTN